MAEGGIENPFINDKFKPDEGGEDIGLDPMSSTRRGSEDESNIPGNIVDGSIAQEKSRGSGARPKDNIHQTSTTVGGETAETSFIENTSESQRLLAEMEGDLNDADKQLRAERPRVKLLGDKILTRINKFTEKLQVAWNRKNRVWYDLKDVDGNPNPQISPTLTEYLGPPADEVVNEMDKELSKRAEKRREIVLERDRASPNERAILDHLLEEHDEDTQQIENERNQIEERMSLRDRVKAIFKKYGFTAFAVISAVGVVIGVIVSNLAKGLGTVARGVGNGLKALGHKIAAILPGMIGAIASFIFRAAGQVLSFLGKNAWLLIMAVVFIVVEQFKKKM